MTKKMQIITELRRNGGNAMAAAKVTGASEGYAQRVKRELALAENHSIIEVPDVINVPANVPQQDTLDALVPANIQAIIELRDDLIENLNERVKRGSLSGKASVDLLAVLLKYETELRAVAMPGIALYEDNSQHLTINTLADKMEGFDPADLRLLAGVQEAIDVTPQEK
jgi:hypothetical protein